MNTDETQMGMSHTKGAEVAEAAMPDGPLTTDGHGWGQERFRAKNAKGAKVLADGQQFEI